ncbi:hypothetical protein BSU04_14840 [Caballeronia sordidicola]|uniref:Uncharacterized protein n=1 Tax=Caballeronia sordidicola TaxID=196367 RepID=A0A226X337_CABSO|nr:hypothetical protein BSU04_14840 [Caballeronia sordidicola]
MAGNGCGQFRTGNRVGWTVSARVGVAWALRGRYFAHGYLAARVEIAARLSA